MPSILEKEQARNGLRMTETEFAEVISLGFSTAVVKALQARGFRRAGTDPDDRTQTQFLRQTSTPNIRLSLHPTADLEALDTAIHEAGQHWMHSQLAFRWNNFTTAMRAPNLADPLASLAARLAALEAQCSVLSAQ